MNNEEFKKINKDGWNNLVKSNKQYANTSLPEYGPFLKRNEEEINLLGEIRNKKILDLGCGAGNTLKYLYNKGATDLYGLDISEEQIKIAIKKLGLPEKNFQISAMEEKVNEWNNIFDIVVSIFSIGYTSDLQATMENVYKYLKNEGEFIISWTHPFYWCLDIEDDKVLVNKSYFDDEAKKITKGPDKIELCQRNLMISTIINTARQVGFYVDVLLEEETVLKDDVNGYKSTFWRKEKTENCPSTIIFKFKKIN